MHGGMFIKLYVIHMSALDWLVSFTLRPLYLRKITLVLHFTKVPTPSVDTVSYKNCLPLRASNPGRSASSQSLLWPIHSGCSTIKIRKLQTELVFKMHGRCLCCIWLLWTLCPTPKLKKHLPLAIRDGLLAHTCHLRHGCTLPRWQGTHLT